MITKFKIFENINEGRPEIDDYVLLKYATYHNDMTNFLNNNIGKIIFIDDNFCIIEYYNVPDLINHRFDYNKINNTYKKTFKTRFISYWSKNREDLEDILMANKYNL
jgi:hypothetical protein